MMPSSVHTSVVEAVGVVCGARDLLWIAVKALLNLSRGHNILHVMTRSAANFC